MLLTCYYTFYFISAQCLKILSLLTIDLWSHNKSQSTNHVIEIKSAIYFLLRRKRWSSQYDVLKMKSCGKTTENKWKVGYMKARTGFVHPVFPCPQDLKHHPVHCDKRWSFVGSTPLLNQNLVESKHQFRRKSNILIEIPLAD